MDAKQKNTIYDRLLEIRFKIDIGVLPDPAEINQKIGECHGLIEEIEHFSIRVSKEISVRQQALNNAVAQYEYKKSEALTKDDIKSLPSIRDREAAVDMLLNKERAQVTEYKNEVTDLNNLLKSIDLKIKNLNRANNDIKMQLRVFEAQARIGGVGPTTHMATRSLMEELSKGVVGQDSFKEIASENEEEEKEEIVDPSKPLDVENFLEGKEEELPSEDEIAEKLIEPVPELSPDEGNSPIVIEDTWLEEDFLNVIDEPEPETTDTETANEKVTNKEEGGTKEKAQIEPQTKVEVADNQKESHTVETGMDLDDLLNSFQPTTKK